MDNIGIYPLVKMFQKEYPNVEVELEYPDYSGDAMDFETIDAEKSAFMTRLFTEISGGNSISRLSARLRPIFIPAWRCSLKDG